MGLCVGECCSDGGRAPFSRRQTSKRQCLNVAFSPQLHFEFNWYLWGIGDSRWPPATLLPLAGSAAKVPAGLAQLLSTPQSPGARDTSGTAPRTGQSRHRPAPNPHSDCSGHGETVLHVGGNTLPTLCFSPAGGRIKACFCPMNCLVFFLLQPRQLKQSFSVSSPR
ncbi:hypothetical protein BJX63DRAFT_260529 [Aspergillus granulosus]|uniref:Uncharacterized protein n=1 Tax=Aspergillus granulosus TaxID=176169 RepID=A0ABR4H9R6_9EURO